MRSILMARLGNTCLSLVEYLVILIQPLEAFVVGEDNGMATAERRLTPRRALGERLDCHGSRVRLPGGASVSPTPSVNARSKCAGV
uniref:Putative secreted protein n=1 Tax=Amblyomma cajennense TaxID=34607 RepID=A0A023FBQ7_AMBCJ